MLQPSRIPRNSTNIKRYHPPFAASGSSDGRQAAQTQSLSTSFLPKNHDKAMHSIAYKYPGTVSRQKDRSGKSIGERTKDQKSKEHPGCRQLLRLFHPHCIRAPTEELSLFSFLSLLEALYWPWRLLSLISKPSSLIARWCRGFPP
ncbi:hypothetical protein AXF42_Ash016116 [Apostasia shenzhenica]|uniref:Uncharacterized protein n=1 Tax=Apostasia shenzhenica TaxID=1088818 RepID=A0A2I0B3F5_9ASPA|nr:hypothetical protein AXF42_Ash016116 [Apostasia shenzhenica]